MSCAEEAAVFVQGPDIRRRIASRLENEVLSVGRPLAAAFVRSLAPSRKQGLKIEAVRGGLPDRAVVRFGIIQCKTKNRTIRRPTNIIGSSTQQQKPPRLASIAIRHKYLVPFAINDPLSIRRP